MRLDRILKNTECIFTAGDSAAEIDAICSDSRKASRGCVFVAVKGFAVDGHEYISRAIGMGARAVVYEDQEAMEFQTASMNLEGIALVKVKSSRHALAVMAANFYDNPSEKLTLVGITGTNGKTTTVTLLYNMFMRMGYNCGLLSTIANYVGTKCTPAINTTSDPLTINSLMNEMVMAGCEYCFMEVSSIGVEQDRVAGLKFKAGIFSNLTHDHLDYHKTFAEYLRCKKLFFDVKQKDEHCGNYAGNRAFNTLFRAYFGNKLMLSKARAEKICEGIARPSADKYENEGESALGNVSQSRERGEGNNNVIRENVRRGYSGELKLSARQNGKREIIEHKQKAGDKAY